jgi:hypothetical protein
MLRASPSKWVAGAVQEGSCLSVAHVPPCSYPDCSENSIWDTEKWHGKSIQKAREGAVSILVASKADKVDTDNGG